MSDLIGRFLSFEEHLGRGLVKFTYYLALFMLVVTFAWLSLKALFGFQLGDLVVYLFQFLFYLVGLRVVTELALAILSIDDSLQQSNGPASGFEAGLTPAEAPVTATTITPTSAPAPADDDGAADEDASADTAAAPAAAKPTKKATKRPAKKATKKAAKKTTSTDDEDDTPTQG